MALELVYKTCLARDGPFPFITTLLATFARVLDKLDSNHYPDRALATFPDVLFAFSLPPSLRLKPASSFPSNAHQILASTSHRHPTPPASQQNQAEPGPEHVSTPPNAHHSQSSTQSHAAFTATRAPGAHGFVDAAVDAAAPFHASRRLAGTMTLWRAGKEGVVVKAGVECG